MFILEDPEKRLLRLLKENEGRYSIDKDGIVSTNWEHPEVQKAIRRQLRALRDVLMANESFVTNKS